MGRFPKEFFPVGDLCFHVANAIQKRGEVCNAMGFRSKLEAGIVKQSNEFIDAFRCVLSFFPKDCGSALIHISDPARGIGIARLRDAPAEWSRQHTMLGLGFLRLRNIPPIVGLLRGPSQERLSGR